MAKHILKSLFFGLLVGIAVAVLVFIISRLTPFLSFDARYAGSVVGVLYAIYYFLFGDSTVF